MKELPFEVVPTGTIVTHPRTGREVLVTHSIGVVSNGRVYLTENMLAELSEFFDQEDEPAKLVEETPTMVHSDHSPPPPTTKIAEAVTPKLSGNACSKCGQFALVRTGHCETCQVCGETTGCS